MNSFDKSRTGISFEEYVKKLYLHHFPNQVYIHYEVPLNIAYNYHMPIEQNKHIAGDYGIDVFIIQNSKITHIIQCKCYYNTRLCKSNLKTFIDRCNEDVYKDCEKILITNSSCDVSDEITDMDFMRFSIPDDEFNDYVEKYKKAVNNIEVIGNINNYCNENVIVKDVEDMNDEIKNQSLLINLNQNIPPLINEIENQNQNIPPLINQNLNVSSLINRISNQNQPLSINYIENQSQLQSQLQPQLQPQLQFQSQFQQYSLDISRNQPALNKDYFIVNGNLYTYDSNNNIILISTKYHFNTHKFTQEQIKSKKSDSKTNIPKSTKQSKIIYTSEIQKPSKTKNYNSFRRIQNEIYNSIMNNPTKNWEINAACGIGKTITFKRIIDSLLQNNIFNHVLILVPQISLAEQTIQVFNSVQNYISDNITLPSYSSNVFYTNTRITDSANQITICVYNSFNEFVKYYSKLKLNDKTQAIKHFSNNDYSDLLIIIDEAHHIKNKDIDWEHIQKLIENDEKIKADKIEIEDLDFDDDFNLDDGNNSNEDNNLTNQLQIQKQNIYLNQNQYSLINQNQSRIQKQNESNNSQNDEQPSPKYIEQIIKFIYQYNIINYSFSATLSQTSNPYRINYSLRQGINDNILVPYNYKPIDERFILNLAERRNNRLSQLIHDILPNPEYKHILIYVNNINFAIYLTKQLNYYSSIHYPQHKPKSESNYQSTFKTFSNCPQIDSRAEYIIADDSKTVRKEIFKKFKKNEIRIIVSVNCIAEGIDLPFVDTVIFFDDRNSDISIIQCCGRALRKYSSKDGKYNKKIGNIIAFKDKFEMDNIALLLNNSNDDYIKRLLSNISNSGRNYEDRILYKFNDVNINFNERILNSITDEMIIEYFINFKNENNRVPEYNEYIMVNINGIKFQLNLGLIFDEILRNKPQLIMNMFNLNEQDIKYLINYIIDVDENEKERLKRCFRNSITQKMFKDLKSTIIINRIVFKKSEFNLRQFGNRIKNGRDVMNEYLRRYKRGPRRNPECDEFIEINGKCDKV